jgi:hypothetical protein
MSPNIVGLDIYGLWALRYRVIRERFSPTPSTFLFSLPNFYFCSCVKFLEKNGNEIKKIMVDEK